MLLSTPYPNPEKSQTEAVPSLVGINLTKRIIGISLFFFTLVFSKSDFELRFEATWKSTAYTKSDGYCDSLCNSFENEEKGMCNLKCDSLVVEIDAVVNNLKKEMGILDILDSCGEVCQAKKIKDSISVNFSMNASNKKLSSKIDMQSLCLKDEANRLALFMVFEEYFCNKPSSTLIPLELKKEKNFWRILTNWSFSENGSIFDVHINICFTSKEAWVCRADD